MSCCSRERAREKTRAVGGDRSRPRPRHAQRATRLAAHVNWLRSQLLFRDSSSEGPFSWLRRSHLMSHEKPPAFFVGKRSPPAHHHSAPPTPFSKKFADPNTADSARCAQHQAKAPSRHPIFLFSPLLPPPYLRAGFLVGLVPLSVAEAFTSPILRTFSRNLAHLVALALSYFRAVGCGPMSSSTGS